MDDKSKELYELFVQHIGQVVPNDKSDPVRYHLVMSVSSRGGESVRYDLIIPERNIIESQLDNLLTIGNRINVNGSQLDNLLKTGYKPLPVVVLKVNAPTYQHNLSNY